MLASCLESDLAMGENMRIHHKSLLIRFTDDLVLREGRDVQLWTWHILVGLRNNKEIVCPFSTLKPFTLNSLRQSTKN